MSSSRRVLTATLAAASVLSLACADFSRGPASAPAGDAGAEAGGEAGAADAGALPFAADVQPLLFPACGRGHAQGEAAGDTTLLFTGDAAADYAVVSRFVDTSAPASSRMLSKMSGNGHGGGTVFAAGSPSYETVLEWIQ